LRLLLVLFILEGNKLNQENIAKKREKRIKTGENAEKREPAGAAGQQGGTATPCHLGTVVPPRFLRFFTARLDFYLILFSRPCLRASSSTSLG